MKRALHDQSVSFQPCVTLVATCNHEKSVGCIDRLQLSNLPYQQLQMLLQTGGKGPDRGSSSDLPSQPQIMQNGTEQAQT